MDYKGELMKKFLQQGTLNKKDLLDFYMGENVKNRFQLLEKEITDITD